MGLKKLTKKGGAEGQAGKGVNKLMKLVEERPNYGKAVEIAKKDVSEYGEMAEEQLSLQIKKIANGKLLDLGKRYASVGAEAAKSAATAKATEYLAQLKKKIPKLSRQCNQFWELKQTRRSNPCKAKLALYQKQATVLAARLQKIAAEQAQKVESRVTA